MDELEKAIREVGAEIFPRVDVGRLSLMDIVYGLRNACDILNDQNEALQKSFDEIYNNNYKRNREYILESLLRQWTQVWDNAEEWFDLKRVENLYKETKEELEKD